MTEPEPPYKAGYMECVEQVVRLTTENEKLRESLRRTANAPCSHCGADWLHGERNTAHFIANQALAVLDRS